MLPSGVGGCSAAWRSLPLARFLSLAAGGFVAGKRHGLGRCHYFDGTKYEGEWREGKRCGQGTCAYASGDLYTGEWAGDRRHGVGACRFADGTKFRGQWEDDGWVQSGADPGRCRVAGAGLTRAQAGREASFAIQVRAPCPEGRRAGGVSTRFP